MDYFLIRDRTLEMTPEGEFRIPPRPSFGTQLLRGLIVVAVLAAAAALAALAFWFAMILIPVAIVAGLAGWAMLRFRLWQAGRRFRPPGSPW